VDVITRLYGIGVVPVVEILDAAAAVPLADTLIEAGIGTVEITFRTPAAADALAAIRRERPELLAGAGTIRRPDQLAEAVDAGAQYIVTPGWSDAVVAGAQSAGLPILPGITTSSEVQHAIEVGVTTLKLYPAELIGGVTYLKALTGPFPEARFMPSGGIDASKLEAYLRVPAVIAVGGSWFVKSDWLASGDFASIARMASEAASIVRGVRPG
jgi:2-dehydro-3-deoxyphosphogluconate aldolase/(4S)-4-hydroxy-2-oxoglutarate aldolase